MYGKLFRQMYRGTLATVGPWEALITFQQFIILADSEGVVDMTPSAIARETTIPLAIIQLGIEALEKPDPESRTPDEEGRRIIRLDGHRTWGWRITNYLVYRTLKREEDRREYHRQYYHKRKQKLNTTQHTQQIQPIEEGEEVKTIAADAASYPQNQQNPNGQPAFELSSRLDKRRAWIEGKAQRLGIKPNPGETWQAYAGRVKEAHEAA